MKSKIECKILKYEWLDNGRLEYHIPFSDGLKKVISGNIYKICARIVSKKKDFSLSDFKVKIKYESIRREIDAYVHYCPKLEIQEENKIYSSDMNNNILFCPVLLENESNDLEIHFIVESKKCDVQYVKFIFVSPRGIKKTVKIKKDEFRYATMTFE